MGHLGESAKQCAARRRLAMQEGERMRMEAAAYHAAHVRGRGRWSRGGEATRSGFSTQLKPNSTRRAEWALYFVLYFVV